ncbi:MAG TPA: response regulator [Terriglobales bacterium]|nr:response regulator [Terriglobales bacterium]
MSISLRILIIEDSEDDAFLLLRELEKGGYEPVSKRVETAEEMSAALKEQEWDLVISDYVLPKFSGLDALRVLKESRIDLPFIVISGKMGEETAVEVMRAGAHDYIMKDKMARLVPAIQRELAEFVVRRERQETQVALTDSEKRFSLFMENFPGYAYLKEQNGVFVFINQYAEKVFGWNLKEAIGRTDFDLCRADLAQKVRERDQQVLSTGQTMEFVETLETEGKKIDYLTYKFPIPRKGQPPLLGGISVDITERKKAEDLVRQTAQELKAEREALEKKNITLQEVLAHIEAEKNQLKKQIVTNVEQAILPNLLRLRDQSPKTHAKTFQALEKDLREIISPFIDTVKDKFAQLTPRELEVCRLIKNGMSSKEIAEVLNMALKTVHKHREIIRRKLGLVDDETNLSTYLQSL